MTSGVFTKAKDAFLSGQITWLNDNVSAVLYNGKVNLDQNETLSELGELASEHKPIANRDIKNATAQGKSLLFLKVNSAFNAVVVFKEDDGKLICYIDLGKSRKPEGDDAQVTWENGKDIFRI